MAELIAYRTSPQLAMRLVPAPSARAWMNATRDRFANRCLPLLIANEAGWFLCTVHSLRVVWNGGAELSDLTIECLAGPDPSPAVSHFGHGILTWQIPFLFRTPPGYNLVVRGPSNWPKDGASPLDGIVETDWAAATFTMNWKLTRKNFPVTFDADEPIGMIFPQRRAELEQFVPEIRDLDSDAEEAARHRSWAASRAAFLTELKVPNGNLKETWQKHYVKGSSPDGHQAPEHQTRLKLRAFEERRAEDLAKSPGR